MTVRGILELETSSGMVEVEVGDPSELQRTPIEVYTANGWAAPRVVSPSNADTPLELYTASGWKGIAQRVFRLVDSAEDGDMDEYVDNNDAFSAIQDSARATDGTWVVEYNEGTGGVAGCVSMPGTGLNYYPDRGDTITSTVEVAAEANGGGVQFFLQDDRNTFPKGYRASINNQDDGQLAIVHQDPGGGDGGDYTVASTTINMSGLANEPLTLEVKTTSPTLTATAFDSNDNQLAQTSGDDSDYSDGGFGFIGSIDATLGENQFVYHDFARAS